MSKHVTERDNNTVMGVRENIENQTVKRTVELRHIDDSENLISGTDGHCAVVVVGGGSGDMTWRILR